MNSMRDVNHIAKFNGQNFPLWKLGFWILLQQHELVKVVTGEEQVPTEIRNEAQVVTNAAAIASWHTKDTLARGYLISTIENDLCELYPKPTKPATTPQQQITNIADVMPLVAGEMDIQPESPPDCSEQPDTTSLHPEDDPAPTEDIPPDIGHSTERGHDPLPSSTPPIRHSPYPLRVHGAHFFQLMSKRQKYMSRHPIQMQWSMQMHIYGK
ncbi:hypothetical protein DAPPUDRAFT_329562 [Daphnia pulex]|uniref:Uncharacterized protein n=1 Tax=Daphnia pulex TaxID=6669 RepID=E9HH00_DAPPU|nr:hypothetical protein DAPPUDRAFT_329562 [Daphnia pulex]|eukprot:EFX68992.1 hypothetical protein DAPPUDRAFT_329562 [Daphnia pulex]